MKVAKKKKKQDRKLKHITFFSSPLLSTWFTASTDLTSGKWSKLLSSKPPSFYLLEYINITLRKEKHQLLLLLLFYQHLSFLPSPQDTQLIIHLPWLFFSLFQLFFCVCYCFCLFSDDIPQLGTAILWRISRGLLAKRSQRTPLSHKPKHRLWPISTG